jgi:hypothetical protein
MALMLFKRITRKSCTVHSGIFRKILIKFSVFPRIYEFSNFTSKLTTLIYQCFLVRMLILPESEDYASLGGATS